LIRTLGCESAMTAWSKPAQIPFAMRPLELNTAIQELAMSKESENKAIVGRWFTDFWGETCNLNIVDELAAPDMLLQYSLHELRRGRDDIKAFMIDFRKAFPDSTSGVRRT
jgi:SnoaL-like polyketide cyclase